MSTLMADAVCGSRRTSGHGNSPCESGSASCAVVAIGGGRADGFASGGEPGGGVWTSQVDVYGSQARPHHPHLKCPIGI